MVSYKKAFITFAIFLLATSSAIAQSNTITSTVVQDKTPPAAMAPSMVINNSDVCVTSTSAGVTTQIFGFAGAVTARDKNCERVKLFRLLYGGGMKVAAISLICQDARVFDAMWRAGTPCPADAGTIGDKAKEWWLANAEKAPEGSIIYKPKVAAIVYEEREEEWHGD